jgi:hypothetical protein
MVEKKEEVICTLDKDTKSRANLLRRHLSPCLTTSSLSPQDTSAGNFKTEGIDESMASPVHSRGHALNPGGGEGDRLRLRTKAMEHQDAPPTTPRAAAGDGWCKVVKATLKLS